MLATTADRTVTTAHLTASCGIAHIMKKRQFGKMKTTLSQNYEAQNRLLNRQ